MSASSASTSRTSPTALRPLRTELGCLARADGSASFSFGTLEAVASVLGPTEVRIRDELTDNATLDIAFQPLSGTAGIPSKTLSSSLHTLFSSVLLLHHHPRSMIQLVLQTTSAPPPPQIESAAAKRRYPLLIGPDAPPSPSEKACLINAASLALLDAGIVARGTVAACACAILRQDVGSVLRQAGGAVLSDAQVRSRVSEWRSQRGLTDVDLETDQESNSDTIVLLDPTPMELNYALSTHVFAYSFSGYRHAPLGGDAEEEEEEKDEAMEEDGSQTLVSDQVFAESTGIVDLEDHQRAADLCREAAKSILGFMRQAIAQRVATHLAPTETA
ncbi:exosome non-catalytic core subunit rrp46 [Thecaphora frezii]